MAKSKGRKPLPDPKERKKCKHIGCKLPALFLEDHCWLHVPEENLATYKNQIENWVKKGRSLEGANLSGAYLKEACLNRAFLKNALLYGANLQKAELREADMSHTDLSDANLAEADLTGAKLHNADLRRSSLKEAGLNRVNLKEANLAWANLKGAFLTWTQWNNALNLTWTRIEKIGEEKEKEWTLARDAYLRLKNYFHQQGCYRDEGKAYYREKLMAKHEEFWYCFKGHQPHLPPHKVELTRFFPHLVRKAKDFFRWFCLWILWALTGFGERPLRTVIGAFVTFVFFGLLHWLGTNVGGWSLLSRGGEVKNIIDCLYFSLVTFVTLGFGDIWPEAWVAKIVVGVEVVFGYVFLGLIVTLIARKMGR